MNRPLTTGKCQDITAKRACLFTHSTRKLVHMEPNVQIQWLTSTYFIMLHQRYLHNRYQTQNQTTTLICATSGSCNLIELSLVPTWTLVMGADERISDAITPCKRSTGAQGRMTKKKARHILYSVTERDTRNRSKKRARDYCSSSTPSGKCSKLSLSASPATKADELLLRYLKLKVKVKRRPPDDEKEDEDGGGSGDWMEWLPIHLLVNRDFIVTSPLKQNLMLTVALSENKRDKLILIGRFRAFISFRQFGLGPDALRVRTVANAGGTSTISEALSVEYFVRKFQATDIVTEMEVEYCAKNWKKVDYICSLYGQRVGVSVSRAMCHPDPQQFSSDMAISLIYKKLYGLIVARKGVSKRHSFSQCILHVWCQTERTAKIMEDEYIDVSQELEIADDVIMVLTVADGVYAKPIFYEKCLDEEITSAKTKPC